MDKSNHKVIVDREYLENLEEFYEKNRCGGNNIFGSIMNIASPLSNFRDTALFLDENAITGKNFSTIIILDDKGVQKAKFNKI